MQQQRPLLQEYLPDQIYWNNGSVGDNNSNTTGIIPVSEGGVNLEEDWSSIGLDFVNGNVGADIDQLLDNNADHQFDVFQQPLPLSLSPEEEASLYLDLQNSDLNLFENMPAPAMNAQPLVAMETNQGMH